jgi:alkanesulfonate monooxygenase SsuD/methylene tetrahydromethanopterin reductase-like flavin-dependent oxidoreductase (luciferase family)
MKVDALRYTSTVIEAGDAAVAAERDGYDGWWAAETQIDPFLGCAVAAQRTDRLQIGTAIVVAFARNPMTVALQANDLQILSGGRFSLGLGSQIKPHITKRYSMEWSKPAARMREFVLAVRAIWESWATGGKLGVRVRDSASTGSSSPCPDSSSHGTPSRRSPPERSSSSSRSRSTDPRPRTDPSSRYTVGVRCRMS